MDTAKILADAIRPLSIQSEYEKPLLDSAVQKGELGHIRVGHIDLENRQFISRLDAIDANQVRFQSLVASIRKEAILNNIIVREKIDAGGKKFQLLSGFRRLTAQKAVLPANDLFQETTVPARILNAAEPDDEAYRISFAENLARHDLSLLEIARACAEIRDNKLREGNMSAGDIEEYLAGRIQKDIRTPRPALFKTGLHSKRRDHPGHPHRRNNAHHRVGYRQQGS
jgi:hypothetical protein